MKNKGIGATAIVVVIIILVVATAGYFLFLRGGQFGTPEDTIHTLIDAFNSRDADEMYNCLSSDVQEDVTKSEIEDMFDLMDNLNAQITVEKVSNVEISGDNATAQVTLKITVTDPVSEEKTSETDTSEMSFVKEDGKWKIKESITGPQV